MSDLFDVGKEIILTTGALLSCPLLLWERVEAMRSIADGRVRGLSPR